MADNDCGCSGSSTTPPGSSGPRPARTVASAFGGNAAVRRGACGPARCPQPPLSEADERSPYCPDWLTLLKTAAAGKLLIAVEGCLFLLESKLSGVPWYDAETGEVNLRFPDFVSSLPKENNYGFLAKVVPTTRKVQVDGVEGCTDEVHQELAAQVLGYSDCGELMIARAPLCGEIPPGQAGNADSQVHIDYLDAPNHEDIDGCATDFRFLGSYSGTRGDKAGTPCRKWSWMRRLKLRASQWGIIPSGSPLESGAKAVVLIPVSGGSEEDPCYEMRVLDQGQGGLPTDPDNCSTLRFKGKGTVDAGWKEDKNAVLFHGLDAPVNIPISGAAGTHDIILPDYPTTELCKADQPVWPVFQTFLQLANINGSARLDLGAYHIAGITSSAIAGGVYYNEARARVTSKNVTFTVSLGNAVTTTITMQLIGYYY